MARPARSPYRWKGACGGALLAMGAGALFLLLTLGEDLARRSYDLPFLWRSEIQPPPVVLVYLDAKTDLAAGGRDPGFGR